MRTLRRRAPVPAEGGGSRTRRLLHLGMVATAGCTAAWLATAPAHAITWDWGPWYSADGGEKAATAWFEEHGDRLLLCDTARDGKAAAAEVYRQTSNGWAWEYFILDRTGGDDGYCREVDAADGHNLAENRWYRIHVGWAKNGGAVFRDYNVYQIYNDH